MTASAETVVSCIVSAETVVSLLSHETKYETSYKTSYETKYETTVSAETTYETTQETRFTFMPSLVLHDVAWNTVQHYAASKTASENLSQTM